MKAKNSIIIGAIIYTHLAILIATSPSLSQPQKVAFYCGRTTDGNLDPATIVGTKGRKGDEHRVIVVWRQRVGNMTPEQRCELVSKRFQLAWEKGNFNHLVPGMDRKSGRGLICAVSKSNSICDTDKMLFSVNSQQDAREIVTGLYDSIRRTGNPTYQSSSNESIDMQELIDSIGKSWGRQKARF
jgi:Circadian oscillating protein COP23